MRSLPTGVLVLLLAGLAGPAQTGAQFEMPDAREMAGIPRPVGDLPDASVSVRLIQGELANNLIDHPVELHGLPAVRTVRTDEGGRAQFDALPPGSLVHAVAVVDGERLESQRFAVPERGGIRVMLVASRQGEPPPQASVPGTVALGSQSRVFVEFGEDGVHVYYLFEVVNRQAGPVTPDPLVFDLPEAARNASLLRESTPQAVATSSRVTVTGPFAPGMTPVHFAYVLPYDSTRRSVALPLPVALEQVNLIVQHLGSVDLLSSQVGSRREMSSEGVAFLVANGPPLQAGAALQFELIGLPVRSHWARTLTLALVVLIVLAGIWASLPVRAGGESATAVRGLRRRREELLADLVRLEQQKSAGRLDEAGYAQQREQLLNDLEHVYAALESALGPQAAARTAVLPQAAAPLRSKTAG